ncbi:MAG: cyclic nucleotide-binding domain-containing protein [Desulfobacterales bacterium]
MKVPKFIKKTSSKEFKIDENTVEHVIDGSIVINSIDLMLDILKKFPAEPHLVRIYADLLLKYKMHEAAAKAYNRSAILFLNTGKMLPAIVAKISQWHIEMPSDQHVKSFLSEFDKNHNRELPIGHFFSKLSIHELKALCSLFENIRLPAGQVVKEIGDPEDHLFFIVSGRLKDSIYLTLQNERKVFRKPSLTLSENDFFGDIYPFNREQRSQSYIETLEPAELVKIPREKLMRICRKYPNIELGIIDLLSIRTMTGKEVSSEEIRKETRHKFTLRLELEIYPEDDPEQAIYLEGDSEDISIGGMSINIEPANIREPLTIPSLEKTFSTSRINVSVVTQTLLLKISGKIAWHREIVHNGTKTLALGMQFDEMSPKIRGLLFALFNSLD